MTVIPFSDYSVLLLCKSAFGRNLPGLKFISFPRSRRQTDDWPSFAKLLMNIE